MIEEFQRRRILRYLQRNELRHTGERMAETFADGMEETDG